MKSAGQLIIKNGLVAARIVVVTAAFTFQNWFLTDTRFVCRVWMRDDDSFLLLHNTSLSRTQISSKVICLNHPPQSIWRVLSDFHLLTIISRQTNHSSHRHIFFLSFDESTIELLVERRADSENTQPNCSPQMELHSCKPCIYTQGDIHCAHWWYTISQSFKRIAWSTCFCMKSVCCFDCHYKPNPFC